MIRDSKNRLIITNERFGTVIAISLTNKMNRGSCIWLCKCDCGKELEFSIRKLRGGDIISCNDCRKNIKYTQHNDLIGKIFGYLQVIRKLSKDETLKLKDNRNVWVCKCLACNNEKLTSGYKLVSGRIKSCGCSRGKLQSDAKVLNQTEEERILTIFNDMYTNNRYRHIKNYVGEFISFNDYVDLVTKNCFYCNSEPLNKWYSIKSKYTEQTFVKYNGIDRVDSNIGYIKSNCRSCCIRCNQAKMDLTEKEFYNHITKIYINLINKGIIV